MQSYILAIQKFMLAMCGLKTELKLYSGADPGFLGKGFHMYKGVGSIETKLFHFHIFKNRGQGGGFVTPSGSATDVSPIFQDCQSLLFTTVSSEACQL